MTDTSTDGTEREWTAQELLDGLREYARDDRDGFSRGITNPVTGRYERLKNLSKDGYCRRFLELLMFIRRPDVVDLGDSPVLTFDKDRWELQDRDGQHVLVKQEAETRFEELVLEGGSKYGAEAEQETKR